MTDTAAVPRVGPPAPGLPRWKFELYPRRFGGNVGRAALTDIPMARSRRLTRQLNGPTQLSFSLDGHHRVAALMRELEQDVEAHRYNSATGSFEPMFNGCITSSQDVLSEQRHTVNVNCWDYITVLRRRFYTRWPPLNYANQPQNTIVNNLLAEAQAPTTSTGLPLGNAGHLGLTAQHLNTSGQAQPSRDRVYPPGTNLGEAIENLAEVVNGFDYDMAPSTVWSGMLRTFFPYKGVDRPNFPLVYGATVSSVSRSINASEYTNYARVIGQSEEGQPQRYGEAWNANINLATSGAGLWMESDSASDVNITATLVEKAQGIIGRKGILQPAYSLGLRPGAWYPGAFEVGDACPLRIQSGRLNVNTWVRILGITWVIGDEGQEDVEVDVGRPVQGFVNLLRYNDRRVAALERR